MKFFAKLRDIQRFRRDHWERAHVALQNQTLLARAGNACLWIAVKSLTAMPRLRRLLTRRPKQHAARQKFSEWTSGVGSVSAGIAPLTEKSLPTLGRKVLIVAELSLGQCTRYRVEHKLQMLAHLGIKGEAISWLEPERARDKLQTCAMVIFYRVHDWPAVMELIAEARRLGVPSFFEIDDLVFDDAAYRANANLRTLPPAEQVRLLADAASHRTVLAATDHAIASTPTIVEIMRATCRGDVLLMENGADPELAAWAAAGLGRPTHADGRIVIGYGSGSRTHDADFAVAAPALVEIMARYPQVRLAIVGDLTMPDSLVPFAARTVRIGRLDWPAYCRALAEFSINLAPLEATTFSDGKSNIKFLEAGALGIPTVCSPARHFRETVSHGVDGLVAATTDEWIAALSLLIDRPEVYRRIGDAARETARKRFDLATLARTQAARLVEYFPPTRAANDARRPRVLMVNIMYPPDGHGGATVVIEQLATTMARGQRFDVSVFTGTSRDSLLPYELLRYEHDGVPVVAVKLPDPDDAVADYDNPLMDAVFAEVLDAVQPDLVHFHSIQRLGASLAMVCRGRNLPYVVTLHDAWWLCEKQFMVRDDGSYCHQTRIDPLVCAQCVPSPSYTYVRSPYLRDVLRGAARLLSPSRFFGDLYLANDFAADRLVVNKNGILPPSAKPRVRTPNGIVRLGYLGGIGRHKGLDVLRDAVERIEAENFELRVVDVLPHSNPSIAKSMKWRMRGKLTVVKPFSPATAGDFYDQIDVLLFPSQWKESFGLVVREALARDIWVIATDSGGTVEDIVPGVNGDVVPMHDAAAFRAAIEAVLRDPARLAGYANPHREKIRSFQQQAEELGDYYRDILATLDSPKAGFYTPSLEKRGLVPRSDGMAG
ncbi:MAG: glycosyltransferase [Alphaproteobacteria bacterium]